MSQKNRYSCTHVLELFENTNILERNIELEAAVGLDLDLSAAQCVLAASIRSSHKVKLIGILLYIARNTISQFWINENIASLDDQYKKVMNRVPLEKLAFLRT